MLYNKITNIELIEYFHNIKDVQMWKILAIKLVKIPEITLELSNINNYLSGGDL